MTIIEEQVEILTKRLDELQPMIAEAREIEDALARLQGRQLRSQARGITSGAKPGTRSRATPEQMEARRQQVLSLVEGNEGITVANLALLMDLPYQSTMTLTKKLVEEGALVQNADKGYSLPNLPSS